MKKIKSFLIAAAVTAVAVVPVFANISGLVSTSVSTSTSTSVSVGTAIKGDADKNGVIDLEDAQLTLRAALMIEELDSVAAKAADVNEDGTVTLEDAQAVLREALAITTNWQ